MGRNSHKSARPLQPLSQVQGSMTGFLSCESKPRNHVREEHSQKRDAHLSPYWFEDSNKIKRNNKTARPTNENTGTKNVGKDSLRKVRKAMHQGIFHTVLPNIQTKLKREPGIVASGRNGRTRSFSEQGHWFYQTFRKVSKGAGPMCNFLLYV